MAPIDLRAALPVVGGEHALARRQHALAGAAATLRRPADAVSGRTAAIMHGLPTLAVPLIPELNARDETGMGRRSKVWLRAGTLDRWQMTSWFGVDLADVARTVVDLARRNRRDGLMAADAALHERLMNLDEMNRALDLARQWPGVCQAREVLSLADARAESPLESLVRLAIHDAGLPAPEPQVWLGHDRVDFYWAAQRLVLEADGRLKYSADERWKEKKREQRLRRLGNRVERVTWQDVTTGWSQTRRILEAALR
ncbi:endonuclease domain-containing protein [uncultured Jatrophihabitans sp.]|uniref:endonuclease domain-containing protein n=1 Tax=uncultured Jatrophihabitans sp. TaxID=1610747 RepID=UPI0035CBAFAE